MYLEEKDLLALLAKKRGKTSIMQFAPKLGVSYQFLSKIVSGLAGPGPKVAAALGYEPVTVYRKASRATKAKAAKAAAGK